MADFENANCDDLIHVARLQSNVINTQREMIKALEESNKIKQLLVDKLNEMIKTLEKSNKIKQLLINELENERRKK